MSQQETIADLLLARLVSERENIETQWRNPVGTKTRHFVVDDLLPRGDCDAIFQAFPRDAEGFFSRDSFREKKLTSADLGAYPTILNDITYAFQDPRIVEIVGSLTGIDHLEPDPKLYAGGLSMMFEGDFLNPHVDNSHDAERERYRRLNLLYYVSPDWKTQNGGNFELWDDNRKISKTVLSAANRLLVMETTRSSWHSVSPVVAETARCCISNYYFSQNSPVQADYFHVTSFTGRPEQYLRRLLSLVDNPLRSLLSKIMKTGRGKKLVNGPAEQPSSK
jgi:Rps23 Pro-64 3,4-dihydroxylase Tpa1-like proline 4-hydroxylase